MKGIGEKKMNRLFGLLLTLALLFSAVPASAQLIEDWENVSVSVFWFDDAANTQMVQAWPVPEDQVQHGYWVTLPAEALGKTIQLMITHPDYGYFFYFNNGTSETQWLLEDNAQDLSDEYAMYIGYSYNGIPQVTQIPDFIKLYASTLQPPFETEGLPGAELLGPEIFAPGAELIVPEAPQGGADLIVPDAPQGGADLIVPDAPHGSGAELLVPQAKPAMASLLVEYVHENGWLIDSQTKVLTPGEHWIYPESPLTAGYDLRGDDHTVVYVDNSGYTQTASVTFYYCDAEPPMVEVITPQVTERPVVEVIRPTATEEPVTQITPVQNATITVRYLDDRGAPIASDQTVTLPGDGTHTIHPDPAVVPAGYTAFAGVDAAQVVVRNGRANQASVSFYFQKPVQTAAPVRTFDVTIYYYDTENREIAPRATMTVQPGVHRIEAPASILNNGFELMSDAVFDLTVYEDGSYDRAAEDVAFWYRPAVTLPTTTKVSVRYLNESGQEIAAAHEVELAVGRTHRVSPDALRVPTGYEPDSAEAIQVTVSAEGYASPAVVNFVFGLRREGTDAPAGQRIDRYGIVNAKVRFRTEPYSTSNKTIIREVPKGGAVYMVANEYNDKGELWTQVIIDNRAGYMQTKFIDMLTQEASDLHARSVGATPVPTFTPAPTPTPTPTEVFVEYITPVPVTPTPAARYAVANWGTGIRTGTGSSDYIMDWLEQDELVMVGGQYDDSQTRNTWCYIRTLDGVAGYVQLSALRMVSQWEADWYREQWEQQHAAPSPTELITNTPEPEQEQGYAYVLIPNTYLRQMASDSASIMGQLGAGEIVYIRGQQFVSGAKWHSVNWNNKWGYIRSEFLQMMTPEQVDLYFDQLYATPTPTATPTSRPGTAMMSGYGYVNGDAVRLRSEASTASSSSTLMFLNRYAMCMVLDTVNVGGQRWYHVRFSRTEGYVHSAYFVEMNAQEFEEFLRSDRYQQGLRNNGNPQDADDVGVQGSGGLTSGEDELLDDYYQSGAQQSPTHAPYVPPASTITNPTSTPTRKPGYTGSYFPVETPVVTGGAGLGESSSELPLPGETVGTIVPPQSTGGTPSDVNGGGSPLAAIIVVTLLAVAGVGVIAVVQHQRKRRRIAMRAAQRRAQQARSSAQGAYNRIGTYFSQQSAAYAPQPTASQTSAQAQQNPLPVYGGSSAAQPQHPQPAVVDAQPAPSAPQRPYARQNQPAGSPQQSTQPRVGRRTAYQQALAAHQQNQNKQNP